ncbi:MAG: acyltransferase family protein [Chitinophagaceae bacterium]
MKERYLSLDVFRGATVAFMIMVNNQAGPPYTPLDHAPWHGCTPTDLVFPFFLFAVGNAMSFVMPRLQQAGTAAFLGKVIKRTLLIFLIGLFLNWCPFFMWQHNAIVFKPWQWIGDANVLHGVRVMGVLQRIALCYFFASIIIYFFKPRGAFFISVVLLLLYWILCATLGKTGDPYSLQGYFGLNVDMNVFGAAHMYHGEGVAFDPEGLASTISAITQVIFGYFVGQYIQLKGKNFEMLSNLFVAGVILIFAGYCWDMLFPINKKIWTSSYVIYTTGLAILTLSILIFIIEFKNARGAWSRFFDVFGKNPLFIFVLSGFLPRVLGLIRIANGANADGTPAYTSPFGWFYEHICKPASSDLRNGSLLYSVCLIIFYWLIVYVLDKRKIYIRV